MAATSRQRQKAETRAAILRTAAEEFDAHGYSAMHRARRELRRHLQHHGSVGP